MGVAATVLARRQRWRYVFRPHAPRSRTSPVPPASNTVHAVLPLALFEAVRDLDVPPGADLDEFHRELTVKRLGTSATVAAQIERYVTLVRSGRRVEAEEVVAVLRLIGRRADASLVFAAGGRLAGHRAARLASLGGRVVRRVLGGSPREGVGFRLARGAAKEVLSADLTRAGAVFEAVLRGPLAAAATLDGSACGFFGSAVAELLRAFTTFEGALFHTQCRARGDKECRWSSAVRQEG